MKKLQYLFLALALAGNSLLVKGQGANNDPVEEYYVVYERAYYETSLLGIHPAGRLTVSKVEAGNDHLTIRFKEPVNSPAIVNIYNTHGDRIYNQYVELNGKEITIRESEIPQPGKHFLHVFTETAEIIYEFEINQPLN